MKNLILLAVVTTLIGFSSCSKENEDEFCWDCSTTTETRQDGWQNGSWGSWWVSYTAPAETYCGETVQGIRAIEAQSTFVAKGLIVTVKCQKK